ncbi:pyridoxal-dependent decarboxylase, exosortase A system-associated [Micromonospora okii]|uniref:pyridoxal-dependent decarboxylase, exosortase A system-associated n=1 Tax=Micromonospora okii TaxID=1182970 RepID=UPI001E2C2028|nr:pyridoxal-dependent decarboxylase, exosortase A system-associated [Micromonospora okii]
MLAVGGVDVARLAERVGTTPFFAYDRSLLDARIARLRSSLPPDVELSYAVKANPMPAVVQHLSHLVDSFDVASVGELRTALDTPLRPDRITFAGPGKTDPALTQAVAADVTVVLESENEVPRLAAIGDRLGLRPRVAVRVNPDFEVKGTGVRLGGGSQQFGVDAERVPALIRRITETGIELLGLHVFAGSQTLHSERLCEVQRRTVDLLLRLADDIPVPVRYLNLGGGFGIPYVDRDAPLDLDAVAANLSELLATRLRSRLPEARVALELGRYIVGECGVYVTRVVDRKVSRGTTLLVTDGGLHHQLAASGNFGQVIRRNFPLAVANRIDSAPTETVDVVGCLCTTLDVLGRGVRLPHTGPGDLIVLFQAGAYGLTASPTAFLSHPPPAEILL